MLCGTCVCGWRVHQRDLRIHPKIVFDSAMRSLAVWIFLVVPCVVNASSIGPLKALSPLEVVQSQLGALKQGDLSTVFTLSSPANKLQTGPSQRFQQVHKHIEP